ncbi:MAG: FKBP-type peptidyl-prolyl cis-trans isomerase, partial [Rikenellaceae bacterium]
MRKVFYSTLITLFSAMVMFYSCAKEVESTTESYELKSLRAWVSINRPDMEEIEEGLFARIYHYDPTLKPRELYNSDWLEVTYRSQLLDGNYYYNMYPDVADTLGTFSYFTHYVPERVSAYNLGYTLSSAQAKLIQRMNIYDSVDIVSISKFAYSGNSVLTSVPTGYQGNSSLPAGIPAIMRMKYNGVISDMYKYERDEVRQYAMNYMQMSPSDTVADLSMMFFKTIVSNPKGDTISKDTTVELTYTGNFTDGFVFDTNDSEVAKAHNIYTPQSGTSEDKYAPMSFTYSESESDGGTIRGFKECVKKMRVGETAKVVFTSNLGYGVAGSSQGKTVIRPN